MKLTKETLKRIIKEELDATLNEMEDETPENSAPAATEEEMSNIVDLLKGDISDIQMGFNLAETLGVVSYLKKTVAGNYVKTTQFGFIVDEGSLEIFMKAFADKPTDKTSRRDGATVFSWKTPSGDDATLDNIGSPNKDVFRLKVNVMKKFK